MLWRLMHSTAERRSLRWGLIHTENRRLRWWGESHYHLQLPSRWLETTQQDSSWRHTEKGQEAFQLEVAERLRGEKSSQSGYTDMGTHCQKRLQDLPPWQHSKLTRTRPRSTQPNHEAGPALSRCWEQVTSKGPFHPKLFDGSKALKENKGGCVLCFGVFFGGVIQFFWGCF